MKKNSKKIFNFISIVLIILFCYAITPKNFQNDTFYSIKIGESILQNGIDNKDHYSIHNLKYTYPHWLYDLILFKIYNSCGEFGIYFLTLILSAILGILVYFINKKISKNNLYSYIATIIIMLLLRPFIAARAQLITFILFSLEILFIEKLNESNSLNSGIIYATLLFLISSFIANIHSAVWPFFFILFFPYIAEWICNEIFEKLNNNLKKQIEFRIKNYKNPNIKFLCLVFVICMFSGILTPLKGLPYTYLIKTLQGNSMANIQEHLPMVLAQNVDAIIVFTFFLGMLIFTKVKVRFKDLFMTFGLMLLSIFSLRQFSMFVLIGGFSITLILSEINNNKENKKEDIKILHIIFSCFVFIISIIFGIYNFKLPYIDEKIYPVEAVKWIKDNLDVQNLRMYNEYDFGSYLLFEDIPVFIDSRADLYTPEFNNDIDVLSDFFDTSNMKLDYKSTFEKYKITHIMLYNNSILSQFLATDKNYKLIYLDDAFVIYSKI